MMDKKFDNIVFLFLIAILPTFLVVFLSFIFMFFFHGINEILQSLIVLPISFIIIPYFIAHNKINSNLSDLGIKMPYKKDIVFFLSSLLILYTYLLFNFNKELILYLSLQTLIVAFSEEFWARGVVFCVLKSIFKKGFYIVLFSSIIFVFITHMNCAFYENLLFRMPGAIIMGIIYYRTDKLYYSVLFHFIYNILGSV